MPCLLPRISKTDPASKGGDLSEKALGDTYDSGELYGGGSRKNPLRPSAGRLDALELW